MQRLMVMFAAALACALSVPASAQSLAQVLADLQSPDQRTRLRAGHRLEALRREGNSVCTPSAPPDVARKLISALEKVQAWQAMPISDDTLVTADGRPSDGEDHSEFYAGMIGCVGSLRHPASIPALLRAAGTGGGAREPLLAMGSEAVVPQAIGYLNDSTKSSMGKDPLIGLLGLFAADTGARRLSAANREAIRNAVWPFLIGRDSFLRYLAIGALWTYSDAEVRATITRVAGSSSEDPKTRDAARRWTTADSARRKAPPR